VKDSTPTLKKLAAIDCVTWTDTIYAVSESAPIAALKEGLTTFKDSVLGRGRRRNPLVQDHCDEGVATNQHVRFVDYHRARSLQRVTQRPRL
jgi:hypothetical protein